MDSVATRLRMDAKALSGSVVLASDLNGYSLLEVACVLPVFLLCQPRNV